MIPVPQETVVVTPELSRQWNEEIEEGLREPYVVIGWDHQTWLTMGIYMERLTAQIQILREIIRIERLQSQPKPTAAK